MLRDRINSERGLGSILYEQSERETGFALYEVSAGWGAVVEGAAGLTAVILPFEQKNREDLVRSLAYRYPMALETSAGCVARETAARLGRYFGGERISFLDLPMDLHSFSPFQQEVYRMVATIPYGKVLTYAAVAAALGRHRAARGIGSAMGRNMLPIVIPCHRVVGSSGTMTGYSAPGGVVSKQWLLRLEGVTLTDTGRIPGVSLH